MSVLWPIIGQGLKNPRRTAVVDDQGDVNMDHLAAALAGLSGKQYTAVINGAQSPREAKLMNSLGGCGMGPETGGAAGLQLNG